MKDKRTFCQSYSTLMMGRHLLIFTFNCKNDFNSKIIKLCFLFYIFAIYLSANTYLINDSIIHDLYLSQGKLGIFYTLKKIGYMILFSTIIKNITIRIFFTEYDIIAIRVEEEFITKKKISDIFTQVTIKCYLFFVLNILNLIFIWVYLASFFTVFKNTQFFVIKNTIISFGISLFSPFILGIFPALLRIMSLSNREKKNMFFAYILSKILRIIV